MSSATTERLCDRPAGAPLFRTPGRVVTAAQFAAAAAALADALPDASHYALLAQNRLAVAISFAAALLRGRPALLTNDRTEAGLGALARRYPGALALAESADTPVSGLTAHLFVPELDAAPAAVPAIPADRLAALVFTSGSTGEPQPHEKKWGALVARSRAAAMRFGLAECASVVGTVPPQHMYGCETTLLLPLHAPAAAWCGPCFYPGDIAAALAACPAPRLLVTTPLQLRALVAARQALPPLAAIISATAPLAAALAQEAETLWAAPVMEIYGATEAGSIATRRTTEGPVWHAYDSLDLRLGGDGTGIHTVHAPGADPVPLSDELALESATRFRLLGRTADMIKRGGKRASLTGLNRILTAIDGVQDGVFLAPDEPEDGRLMALVVAPDGDAERIMAALRSRIDPAFLPRRIIHVTHLPRNVLGKLPRTALDALIAKDAG